MLDSIHHITYNKHITLFTATSLIVYKLTSLFMMRYAAFIYFLTMNKFNFQIKHFQNPCYAFSIYLLNFAGFGTRMCYFSLAYNPKE